jgi:3,4-dihydroxy 2-butanone 4-phosphate synthase / GTP cyclohydrolase II
MENAANEEGPAMNKSTDTEGRIRLDTIEKALEAIRAGKVVIVVDDEDRENEGDMICASSAATPEVINYMTKFARGLICCSIPDSRADELGLGLMVGNNTALHATPFTVSVDLLGDGCTTGISASDRSKTVQALINPITKPEDLGRPGHIFPLKARPEGVLRRSGHTEAAMDLARMAGFYPSGVLVEIMDEDGEMARLPRLREIADEQGLMLCSIQDLIAYRLRTDRLVQREIGVEMPTMAGTFELLAYRQLDNDQLHLALVKGDVSSDPEQAVLVRVHSSCMTGDIFGSCRCDCGPQLEKAMEAVEKEGRGVVLYMNQEGRGIGLLNKLRAYKLQEQGRDTVEANLELGFKMDERDYGVGAQILSDLGIRKIRLLSNNPKKRAGLIGYGLEIVENVPLLVASNPHNAAYLRTKRDRMGHDLPENEEQ